MIAKAKAITWEFWRENRWWWFCLVALVVGLGTFITLHEGRPHDIREIHPVFLCVVMILECMLVSYLLHMKQYNPKTRRIGFHTHLYFKPIPTWSLIVGRLSLALLATIAFHGVVTLTFKLGSNITLPFLKSALLIALTIAWAHALSWLFNKVQWLQVIGCGLSILPHFVLIALWVEHRENETAFQLLSRIPLWWAFTGLAGAYLVAWLGVALDRRSVALDPGKLLPKRQPCLTLTKKPCRPHSPFWALYRFEMRCSGWQWSMVNAAGFLVLLVFWLTKVIPAEAFGGFLFLGVVINATAFPILIGMVVGQHSKSRLSIEPYKAVKPVPNGTFLKAYLLAGLSSLALAWFVYMIGTALIYLGLLSLGETDILNRIGIGQVETSKNLIYGIHSLFGCLVAIWTLLTLSGTVMIAGRRWLAITVWLGIWIIPAIMGIIVEACPNSIEDEVASVFMLMVIFCILGGTLTAFGFAIRRNLMGRWTLVGCVAVYLILAFLFVRAPGPKPDKLDLILMATALTLPLLPMAAAPLAIAWNRHR